MKRCFKGFLFILLFILLLTACSTVPLTGRKRFLIVSDKEVLTMSLKQYNQYILTAPISHDKKSTEMVIRVGQRIAKAVETYLRNNGLEKELTNYNWEFHLIKDNTPNAFCMPGGKIVVNEGILPFTKTEDGLAVVLGHEVAHAVAKHSNEQISQQMLVQMGGIAVGIAASEREEIEQVAIMALYGLGSQVGIMLPYSRKHEYEADQLGLIFMTMAGYNPKEAVTFWQRMSNEKTSSSDFLSTHPSDKKRIEAIKKNLPKVSKYAPFQKKLPIKINY